MSDQRTDASLPNFRPGGRTSTRRATLQDVADEAGVSRTTASFVVNDRDEMRISEATQARVRRAMRELGYRPNPAARALKTRLTDTIALLSEGITTEGYAGPLIAGALERALAAGRVLYIGESGGDPRIEAQLVDDFTARHVSGFVYASGSGRPFAVPPGLRGQRLVLVNCEAEDEAIPAVLPDWEGGGRAVAEHLIATGHCGDIYLVGETPAEVAAGVERRDGVVSTLTEHGVALAGQIDCRWWPESAFEALMAFLSEGRPPRALICINDRIALGCYQALGVVGLRVPDRVSVVSFDDSPMASWLQPQLTSAALRYREMGRLAVEVLVNGDVGGDVHRVAMPLHVRSSVASPS